MSDSKTIGAEVIDGVINFTLKVGDGVARIPVSPDVARQLATELFDAANLVDPEGFKRIAAAAAKQFAHDVHRELEAEFLKNAPVQGRAH